MSDDDGGGNGRVGREHRCRRRWGPANAGRWTFFPTRSVHRAGSASLAVNDDCCRENLCLMADTSISGTRVARELDALVPVFMASPPALSADNGTEFTSRAILKWANENGVDWHYIDPGKPQQNAFIESHSTAACATSCLNEEMFDSLDDARRKLALWRYDYNNVRPHSSLGNQTPAEARRAHEQFEGSAPDALAQTKTEAMKTRPANSRSE